MIHSTNKKLNFIRIFHRIFKVRDLSTYFLNLKSFYRYKYWLRDFIKLFVCQLESTYPSIIKIRISRKLLDVVAWDSLDRMTINEIFCWECYKYNSRETHSILDLGGNIGISAKYFLTQNPHSNFSI